MKIDPLLLVGMIMLGMALGALLTWIRVKSAVGQIVREQLDQERAGFHPQFTEPGRGTSMTSAPRATFI